MRRTGFAPTGIINLATLTGAIIVALGAENAGVFSNDDALCNAFLKAAATEGEGAWRMPMGQAYDDKLKSRIADMMNVGGREGGAITAAQFIKRFIKEGQAWIHLDIAGGGAGQGGHRDRAKGGNRLGRSGAEPDDRADDRCAHQKAMTATCRAMFYHLTRSGMAETLLTILPRALGAGWWRVMVRGTDPAAISDLDMRLWAGGDGTDFLPHGLQGGPHDAEQPILLGTGDLPDAVAGLVLIDGAVADPQEIAHLQRVWVLFDGNDADQLTGARALWTKLTAAGIAAQYWSEDSGKWVLKVGKKGRGRRNLGICQRVSVI